MLLLLSLACTQDQSFSRRSTTDVFLQEPESEVDILFVVDDSISMANEQQRVAEGFGDFIFSLEETNIDFHVGVVSTDMDLDNPKRGRLLGNPPVLTPETNYVAKFQNRVQVGTDGSDKEKGLAAAIESMSEPLASGDNIGFLRDDAILTIIFVSDENDCSDNDAYGDQPGMICYDEPELLVPPKQILDRMRTLKRPGVRVIANAIIGPTAAHACEDAWPGHRYRAIADATGGLVGDICDTDYSAIMEDLGLSVSGVLTTFELSHSPVLETLEVLVNNELIEEDPVNGWTYEPEYRMLRFDGDYVPARGSTINVSYEVGVD